ncbi:coiled-coil domain-containing protein [Nitrosopumilus maritimus]|uniref:coiled-coil domain-containing protein n=1 Tax=Nitrosopumilus maritimus TaxID=338192 RepID=UPI001EE538A9|nr:DNA repair protein [Nitrosopumilus maritimus]
MRNELGLFGKKEDAVSENNEESVLKKELETEVESLQNEFRRKQDELNDIQQKIDSVKEEYETAVSNLMLVKKELNQKKMELDIVLREYKETKEKIIESEKIKNSESFEEFTKTEENLSKVKQELEEITKEYEKTKESVASEQSMLSQIRKQQVEAEKELDEANSRLYNAKEELNKKDEFQDTNILTPKEREFIQGDNKSSAGVIEAASAVVGSLKSKLNNAHKELEAIQLLLEKEREEHEETKKELDKLKSEKS